MNMAVDEALLESYLGDDAPVEPTLRLYGWDPPALSLGRRQDARGAHDPVFLASERIDLVRRPTGGAAVLHERERTYCVAGRLREEPFPGGVLDTYCRVARALVRGLELVGLEARSVGAGPHSAGAGPLCFARTSDHEIAVGADKLVGSAQLRRRGAFLQHGSIPSRGDASRAGRATGTDGSGASFAGVEDLLGRTLDPAELDAALIRGFELTFDVSLCLGDLSPKEIARAEGLRRGKYTTSSWTLEGV